MDRYQPKSCEPRFEQPKSKTLPQISRLIFCSSYEALGVILFTFNYVMVSRCGHVPTAHGSQPWMSMVVLADTEQRRGNVGLVSNCSAPRVTPGLFATSRQQKQTKAREHHQPQGRRTNHAWRASMVWVFAQSCAELQAVTTETWLRCVTAA